MRLSTSIIALLSASFAVQAAPIDKVYVTTLSMIRIIKLPVGWHSIHSSAPDLDNISGNINSANGLDETVQQVDSIIGDNHDNPEKTVQKRDPLHSQSQIYPLGSWGAGGQISNGPGPSNDRTNKNARIKTSLTPTSKKPKKNQKKREALNSRN